MAEDNLPEVHEKRLAELMNAYARATTREEEREIETEVLKETVWRVETDGQKENWATFSQQEWRWLTDNVEAKNEKAAQMLRKPDLKIF